MRVGGQAGTWVLGQEEAGSRVEPEMTKKGLPKVRHPGLDPGSRFSFFRITEAEVASRFFMSPYAITLARRIMPSWLARWCAWVIATASASAASGPVSFAPGNR